MSLGNIKLLYDCWVIVMKWLPRHDIASISRTSRVSVHIHKKVSIPSGLVGVEEAACLASVTPVLQSGLDSCVENASLVSSHVPCLGELWELPTIKEEDNWWTQASDSFQEVVEYAAGLVRDAEFPFPDKWINALQDGNVHGYVAILLSQLHNPNILLLDYTFVWQSS